METRPFPRTPYSASVVGLGTWQLGADWGEVTEAEARDVLEASASAGVTFYDTADVYGDGRSEQVVGAFVAAHPSAGFTVATKMGRRAEQVPESYTPQAFRAWVDRSRRNLGTRRRRRTGSTSWTVGSTGSTRGETVAGFVLRRL